MMTEQLLARLAASADIEIGAELDEPAFARIVASIAAHCASICDSAAVETGKTLRDPRIAKHSPQHAVVRGGVMQAEKLAKAIRAVFGETT
jgi:hypothetical protein